MRTGSLITTVGAIAGMTLAASAGTAATAAAATTHRPFVETEAGTMLSTTGNRFEDLFRIKSSPFGGGTTVRDVTLGGRTFPASGRATAVAYYKDGRLGANETLSLGAPDVAGVGSVSGTGTCTSGTFKHQHETCTYTIKGSYDLVTSRMFLTLTGTYTPAQTTTKKKKS